MAEFHADVTSLVVDELAVCQGEYRIDIAVINGSLHGYEIKSDRDTLSRLPTQSGAYSRVFDTMTLVVGRTHLKDAVAIVPEWWRVLVAERKEKDLDLDLVVIREGGRNPTVDPIAVAQLLWREELVTLLTAYGAPKRLLRRPRWDLWPALAERMTIEELAASVRRALKARQGWRSAD